MKIAGIDVHKKVLMVVVVDSSAPEVKPARRRFVRPPSELQRLRIWLQEQGVEEAVMESTAPYWRSVWLELEPHMRLHLAQAFSGVHQACDRKLAKDKNLQPWNLAPLNFVSLRSSLHYGSLEGLSSRDERPKKRAPLTAPPSQRDKCASFHG